MDNEYPLKVIQADTLQALAKDLNEHHAVAVTLMPRFVFEVTVKGQDFQVQVTEIDTGHDFQVARDVAGGMLEALNKLVERLDEYLAKQNSK
jgi:hypothetical protein